MKRKKKDLSTVILMVIFIVGLSLLLYPSLSDYWNSFHQSRAIAEYSEAVANMDQEKYDTLLKNAQKYNKKLAKTGNIWNLSKKQIKEYEKQLNVTDTGIMSYIEIPSIRCSLPIYHGTEEKVLQIAIGHIEGTSLPVGGESTHCVLSGHRGLPSAKLFTDLDKLKEGDIFIIRTLDETLTYEVDQIRIVLPDNLDELQIKEGEDLCTLVTCTPYGVNTHRLLVRGHRVPNQNGDGIRATADALQLKPVLVAPIIAIPILILILIGFWVSRKKKKKM